MSRSADIVSIHPYFKVHTGKMNEFKASLPAFTAKTAVEQGNLLYDFTVNGDEVFCREYYTNAEAALAHLASVGAMLQEALKIADLVRVEIHGPAAELEKMKAPLAEIKPAWFVRECGVER